MIYDLKIGTLCDFSSKNWGSLDIETRFKLNLNPLQEACVKDNSGNPTVRHERGIVTDSLTRFLQGFF